MNCTQQIGSVTVLPILSLLAFAARTGGPGSPAPASTPWAPPISAPRSSSLSASVSLSTSGAPEKKKFHLFCGQRELLFQIMAVPNWKQFLKIRINIRAAFSIQLNRTQVRLVLTKINGNLRIQWYLLTNITSCNNKHFKPPIYSKTNSHGQHTAGAAAQLWGTRWAVQDLNPSSGGSSRPARRCTEPVLKDQWAAGHCVHPNSMHPTSSSRKYGQFTISLFFFFWSH